MHAQSPENQASAPAVAIVIVGFGNAHALTKCVESIERGHYRNFRIFLIDNSLTNALEERFSRVSGIEYLRSQENLGFSRGCNLGIIRSLDQGFDYTLLLNPDTELDAGCIEALVVAAERNPHAGIVGGRIHIGANVDDIWYAGGKMDYLTGVGKHLNRETGVARETTYVTGCCMLIANAVLKHVGGLDERIFMYLDDAEFCMRVRRAGYALYYDPEARLSHAVGTGMDWRRHPDYYLYFSVRNRPLITRRQPYKAYLHAAALAVALGKAIRYALAPRVTGRRKSLRAVGWGAWDSLFAEARERIRLPEIFGGDVRGNPSRTPTTLKEGA